MKMVWALVAVIVVAALAALTYFFLNGSFGSHQPAIPMTRQNAGEVFNLTDVQRQSMQDRCVGVYQKFKDEFGTLHIGKPEDVERNVNEFGVRSCACVLRELERRSTTLQFNLAMESEFRAGSRGDFGIFSYDTERMNLLKSVAENVGINDKEFETQKSYAVKLLSAASTTCGRESN